jgi:hypothetical protein
MTKLLSKVMPYLGRRAIENKSVLGKEPRYLSYLL